MNEPNKTNEAVRCPYHGEVCNHNSCYAWSEKEECMLMRELELRLEFMLQSIEDSKKPNHKSKGKKHEHR